MSDKTEREAVVDLRMERAAGNIPAVSNCQKEREMIVAWLREQVGDHTYIGHRRAAASFFAGRIERGDHLPAQGDE